MINCANSRYLIINEVSLEGLDGITLQALWVRLSEELKVQLPFSQSVQEHYWNIVRKIEDFRFYELEEPRHDLVNYDRFAFIDTENDNSYYEPDELPEDIYPYNPINDVTTGNRGSCATYNSRSDITDTVRNTSYIDVVEKWGSKLVIVASQECREQSLIGSQSLQVGDLTITQYCLLERIGRARYHGEITQGKRSLQVLGEDPKSLFYHRKALLKYKLITKQVYHQKCGNQNFSGTLLHLHRYYSERKPKPLIVTEQIAEYLRNKPQGRAEYADIIGDLNINTAVKKLFKTMEFQRFIKTDIKVPYREIYPNATIQQWKHKNSDKERQIRVMQIIDPDLDIAENWCKIDENDEDDEETGFQDYENLCFGVSLLSQAATIVREHGPNGCSQTELGNIMGQTKLSARSFCRNLLRRNAVTCVMNDVGRQRVTRFVSRKFENKGTMTLQFKQEQHKMMSLITGIAPESIDSHGQSNQDTLDEAEDLEEYCNPELETSSHILSAKHKMCNEEYILPDAPKLVPDEDNNDSDKNEINSPDANSTTNTKDTCSNRRNKTGNEESSEPPNKKRKMQDAGLQENVVFRKRKMEDTDNAHTSSEKKMKTNDNLHEQQKYLINTTINTSIDQMEVSLVKSRGVKSSCQGLTEQLKNDLFSNSCLDGNRVTYRLLKRANFIIECVRQEKVIADLTKLMKMIKDEESYEGYNAKIDKKSLLRLLVRLAKDGYIKYMKATLSSENKVKCIYFVCDTNIDESHSIIQSALDQIKMKFYIEAKPVMKVTETKSEDSEMRKEMSMVCKFGKVEYKYDRTAPRKYGYSPKFVRMRIVHELLFHIIYEEKGLPISNPDDIKQFLLENEQADDPNLIDEMSPIYYREISWKMFIPPIPLHVGWPKGWTLSCDVLLRLPLSIFVRCFHIPYEIDDIDYYLNHPIRKHLLVKQLPPKMRNCLMYQRKYIFAMHEIMSRLCYIGLLQFGPQRLKEKDQVFIYLNRRATLYNTTTSKPGYHEVTEMEYEKRSYYFETFQDVDQYWYELWTTCMNTNLGGRTCVTGQYIVLEQLHTKLVMLNAVTPRLPEEASVRDTGEIPGDKKGAAGLDSALFAHLKRNWCWLNSTDAANVKHVQPNAGPVSAKVRISTSNDGVKMVPVTKKTVSAPKPANKIQKKTTPINEVTSPRPIKYKIKQKRVVRKVLPRRKRIRKPFYDEIDKQALKKMDKLRTDWSPLEDYILLLCTVGSKYLCPNRYKQIVSFVVIRDVLHRLVSSSVSKTSRACQRRIAYIMKNVNTRRSVNMCLEEVHQNQTLTAKYRDIVKRNSHVPENELNIAFVELVLYMSKMFSKLIKQDKPHSFTLPDSIKEFQNRFHVSECLKKPQGRQKEPQSAHDITFNVIKTVIHSSMCCTKDKTTWAYQLFKVYQQYPESLLRAVINRVRHEQMISLKKAYIHSHKAGNYMLLSSSPYQLSISYKHQLHSKYPYNIYTEAFDLIKQITLKLNESNAEAIEVLNPRSGTAVALTEMMHRIKVDFKFDIPDEVIVLDPKVKNDSAYERIIKRFYNIIRDPESFSNWEAKQNSEMGPDDDEANFPHLDYAEDRTLLLPNAVATHRPNSRIAFYMMRAEMCEGVDEKSSQHIHDFFVVNASKVFLKFPALSDNFYKLSTINYPGELLPLDPKICANIITRIKNDALIPDVCVSEEKIIADLKEQNANDADIEFANLIIETSLKNEIFGCTLTEIREIKPSPYNGNLTLMVLLDILTNIKIILRTGVECIRYVHFQYKKPWIINSFKILRLEKEKINPALLKEHVTEKHHRQKKNSAFVEFQKSKLRLDLSSQKTVKVLLTPWLRIDGSLNRRVLDRWLGAVLNCCVDQPGISLETLSHKFTYMKPVDVMSLVEYLRKISSVELITVRRPKVTLFSSVPTITRVLATGSEDPKNIYVEPAADAISKLAVFIGEKCYATDFLT